MKSFKQHLTELQDPISFIKKASERFGTKSEYAPYWDPAPIGQHVPLPGFDNDQAQEAVDRLFEVRWKVGGIPAAQKLEKLKTFNINELKPTQPYNYTGDEDILRVKMAQTNPPNVFIVTHEGEDYVIDGHHSVMGARLRGDDTITARHMDLDQY